MVCACKINDFLVVKNAGIKTDKIMSSAHGATVGLCSPALAAWEVLPDDGARYILNTKILLHCIEFPKLIP